MPDHAMLQPSTVGRRATTTLGLRERHAALGSARGEASDGALAEQVADLLQEHDVLGGACGLGLLAALAPLGEQFIGTTTRK